MNISDKYDVCIIGSGAGAGPVALELSKAGHNVVILEKGPWFTEDDFAKDELTCSRRSVFTPALQDEHHVIENYAGQNSDGSYKWASESTFDSGWDFWNGNMVGGSSNLMSGFFYRLKPKDFRLLSEYGPIKGANIADWPISYSEFEPYYTKVEQEVGISGKTQVHPFMEPRSTPDFPYPPTTEHPVSKMIDSACEKINVHSLRTARAILSTPKDGRRSCEYSGFCGSYACSSGAKGSSRAALLDRAIQTGKCKIIPHAHVSKINSNAQGKASNAEYFDRQGNQHKIHAKIFVVACQAIETSRLLLSSTGAKHENGLGNQYNQVGKNLLFSAGGSGYGELYYKDFNSQQAADLKQRGPFVNRGVQDWYHIFDSELGGNLKGGTIDFLLRHPNAISRANAQKHDDNGNLVWGSQLKKNLKQDFTESLSVRFEAFCDWLPTDDCFVDLSKTNKDKWQLPVAKVRIGYHDHDLVVGEYLVNKAKKVLSAMNAKDIRGDASGDPPTNLQAGGCRFGSDPANSVLDPDCRVHSADNVFVTDGSWMPTGGSVPYTWTIYANSFRVADKIIQQL